MGRGPAEPLGVLVLCTGNSARSQIAEALLRARGAGRVRAWSAGSHPAPVVHPYAIAVLHQHGIEWSGKTPKSVADIESESFDLVITVCDNARDACPVVPGAQANAHWGLPDPAAAEGHQSLAHAFDVAFDALSARVDALLRLPLERLSAAELVTEAAAIHQQAMNGERR